MKDIVDTTCTESNDSTSPTDARVTASAPTDGTAAVDGDATYGSRRGRLRRRLRRARRGARVMRRRARRMLRAVRRVVRMTRRVQRRASKLASAG